MPTETPDFREPVNTAVSTEGASRLIARANRAGDLAVLHRAVTAFDEILRATPRENPNHEIAVLNLANALVTQFELTGKVEALDRAIALLQDPEKRPSGGSPTRAAWLPALGWALMRRAERTGSLAVMKEAVAVRRKALRLTGKRDPAYPDRLMDLGGALASQFSLAGDLRAIAEAVRVHGAAIAAAPSEDPRLASRLSNLGAALDQQALRTLNKKMLDDAVAAHRQAVAESRPDDPYAAMYLSNLGITLFHSYEQSGSPDALGEAVMRHRDAIADTPEDHVELAPRLANLGAALLASYELTGDLAILDDAVLAYRQAVRVTHAEHANRVRYLSGLAGALGRRGEHTGDLASLDEAVGHLHEVIERTPAGHPNRPDRLSSFATTTLVRMQHAPPEHGRLGQAIDALREAVRIAPKSLAHRAIFLSNLGVLLERQHEQDHKPETLDEAVSWHRAAVAATPPAHSDLGKYLSNLAGALAAKARLVSDVTVAEEAVQQAEAALNNLPRTGPASARALLVLGAAHASHFDLAGDQESLTATLGALSAAAGDGAAPAMVRIKAGHDAGHVAAQTGAVEEALEAFGSAVRLLDELAWTGIARTDQERLIGQLNGLPEDAAAMAVKAGRLEYAVELLEQGRGVLLGRALDMPSQYLSLRERAPDLAEKLSSLQQALDLTAAPSPDPGDGWPQGPGELQGAADRRSELARERDALLAQVRVRPDLADVVAPPQFPGLKTAAAHGPVIIVNVSSYGCDALLVTTDGVRLVALPGLTAEAAVTQATTLLDAADRAVARDLNPVLAWIWDSIAEPVFRALGLTSRPPAGQKHPHLWWCATGITAFLPLHAAGSYDESGMSGTDTALDLAVSSYTPTLRTLIRLRERTAEPISPQVGPVIVAMPVTPGAPDLDGAVREVEDLTERFPSSALLSGPSATRAAVMAAMPDHPWAHFSCHGTQNTLDPSAGRLLLHDGSLEIRQIAALRLAGASFAYLSACDTYRGGKDIPDEGITLAAALQLAGYQHVIATLWQVSGLFVSDLSRRVYDQIVTQNGGAVLIDVGGAAAALRTAISDLRAESPEVPPMYWAAYVHTGP